jgi:hypothetical protein
LTVASGGGIVASVTVTPKPWPASGGGEMNALGQLRKAVAEDEESRLRGEEAKERCRSRMLSGHTEALQAEVDRLRVCVTVVFQLLISRGVFTAEEAQQFVAELDTAESEGSPRRDIITGAGCPPEADPFSEFAPAELAKNPSKPSRRARFLKWILAAALILLSGYGLASLIVAVWFRG